MTKAIIYGIIPGGTGWDMLTGWSVCLGSVADICCGSVTARLLWISGIGTEYWIGDPRLVSAVDQWLTSATDH